MKLLETNLPSLYSQFVHDKFRWDFGPAHLGKLYDVLFTATASVLSDIKSKDRPVALVIKGMNNVDLAAGIVQYFPNEDEANPGNWSLAWTFNSDDIPADTLKISLGDGQIQPYYIAEAASKYGIQFMDSATLETALTEAVHHLKKWLDENAKENEEVTVEEDSVFVARVAVENGEKVFALEMDGLIKQIIKDDSSIEK